MVHTGGSKIYEQFYLENICITGFISSYDFEQHYWDNSHAMQFAHLKYIINKNIDKVVQPSWQSSFRTFLFPIRTQVPINNPSNSLSHQFLKTINCIKICLFWIIYINEIIYCGLLWLAPFT